MTSRIEEQARELEQRLMALLVAGGQTEAMPTEDEREEEMARVRQKIERLKWVAAEFSRYSSQVGLIPNGYPRHVDLVMRVLSALLPWYTRPIRASALKAAECMALLVELCEELALELGRTHKQDGACAAGSPTTTG